MTSSGKGRKKKVAVTQDRSVHFHGKTKQVSIVSGDNARVQNAFAENIRVGQDTKQFIAAVRELNKLFADLQLGENDHSQVQENLIQVAEEAAKPKPDKSKIGTWLEKALEYAKAAGNFKELAVLAAPYVSTAAAWVGETGKKLLEIIK